MSEVERESMEVDVLYVGAGPATLSSAYHLVTEVRAHNERAEAEGLDPIEEPTILVIEKAAGIGDHQLSGGVMNPRAIRELIPDFEEQGFPTEYICGEYEANYHQLVETSGSFRNLPAHVHAKAFHRIVRLRVLMYVLQHRHDRAPSAPLLTLLGPLRPI